jgi:iron complex outermembrane receptor protein
MHAVWKPEPKSQDQVRISLTRSYRSPTLGNLIGSTRLAKGVNSPTNPDRTGNPELRPELATGIDLAYERYLPGGGMLSANVFRRQIEQLMRTVTVAQAQPDGSTRYVAQPMNVGNAITQGLELEAKFRLTEVWAQAPAVDVRANASLFNSKVAQVPGPNNRLDQQPAGTANLGADYKLPGLPWTLGSSLNWTPGYSTRLSDTQTITLNAKRVIEAYALWQIDPTQRLRFSASNLAPQGMDSRSTVGDETATTLAQTFVSWRLQWEAKL